MGWCVSIIGFMKITFEIEFSKFDVPSDSGVIRLSMCNVNIPDCLLSILSVAKY